MTRYWWLISQNHLPFEVFTSELSEEYSFIFVKICQYNEATEDNPNLLYTIF